jgi:APA family basic amino acid/polyamine antiporter
MSSNLERTLGLRDLVLLVIGSVIGSGIFLVPGIVLKQTGGYVGPMMIVWAVAGVLSLLGALTYGELAAMYPKAGGLYVYVRDAFGPLPAFLLGWTLFFVIGTGAVATLSVAFATYLDHLVPLSPFARRIVPPLMIAVLAAVNVRGARSSASVQNLSTAVKTTAIVAMGVLLVVFGKGLGHGAAIWPERMTGSMLSGLGLAVVGVLWAYEGWQFVTFAAGEVVEPGRTFPRGIFLGTLGVTLIYLLANLGYAAALGPARMAQSTSISADAVGALFGPTAEKLIAAAILVAIFSCANALTFTSPRVFFAMARDGVFFRRLAEVHPRYGSPAFAILAGSAWAMLLTVTGTFEQLLTYVVFAGWIFYALGAMSIFVFRRRLPDAHRPFRVPGYPLTPVAFVLASAAIVLNTLITQPKEAAIGLAVVLAGTPAFYLWRARSRRDPVAEAVTDG